MIKNVKIRILAFFMVVTLSFCVCSNQYYEVKALEWVAPVVGLDTALKALLGLLGISASVGLATQIDWSDLQDDCVQYQIQKGNDAVAVGRWWDKVISGGLDTASSCWESFKEWAKTQISSSSQPVTSGSLQEYINSMNISNINTNNIDTSVMIDNPYGFYRVNNGIISSFIIIPNFTGFRLYNAGDSALSFYVQKTSIYYYSYSSVNNTLTRTYAGSDYLTNIPYDADNIFVMPYQQIIEFLQSYPFTHLPHEWVLDGGGINTGTLDGAISDLGTIGLAPDVATDLPYDGVIDIPWENVGATDTAIDDAFDDALDKVNIGAWTLDQYWTWVQNVTNVFAYDTTNNYLLPNDGDDEKADDKIQQNIQRGAMVLYGLEKVFPFCIPWDIYAFVNLLVADPVAPVIEYPIYNPVSGEDEIIIIDFSVWESQVILMRYIQDFLLIIGLLLLARSLIGAGGSD